MVERSHRALKAALTAHRDLKWTETLPTTLLGLRAALKDDLGASMAEMVYGSTLRLPGDFMTRMQVNTDPSTFVGRLWATMQRLRPVQTSSHKSPGTVFVHPALQTSSHVFLHNDKIRAPLTPPYDGPFKVVSCSNKTFVIIVRERLVTVSIDTHPGSPFP